VPAGQSHRTIVVGQYHELLQQRRRDQQTQRFKERMYQRSAIEGTISELARAHGLRRSRYRGFAKVELQNLFIATACNVKRWLRTAAEIKIDFQIYLLVFKKALYIIPGFFWALRFSLSPGLRLVRQPLCSPPLKGDYLGSSAESKIKA
jgi:hypothetical protein